MSAETQLPDFSKADFTAIVSDLHLTEEEPVNEKYPLWKKYKTGEFFFDEEFKDFLEKIIAKANGGMVELVLNGDIFDFDSVMALPEYPTFDITWLEEKRGLHPQEEKSTFKMEIILRDHPIWVQSLREFIMKGNRAIFTIGNHDVELHFPKVQECIVNALNLPEDKRHLVRFCEWFYISNGDTLIEHGNQYDPYCMSEDPVNPFVQNFNRLEVKVPFGNLATRYLINGMGFFNPHLDGNYIMKASEYVSFFFKYIARAQPFLMITYLWSSSIILVQSFIDRLRPHVKDPLATEDRIEEIAAKSNATPRMVRELKNLFVAPAASNPGIILKELWLDRLFMVTALFIILYFIFLQVDRIIDISIWWVFGVLLLFFPFFLFYARSVSSSVSEYKEPREKILSLAGLITKTSRICFGHTHIARHELIGAIEHLNSGTWSPAFADIECEKPLGRKTFIYIEPGSSGMRESRVYQFVNGEIRDVFAAAGGRADRQKLDEQKAVAAAQKP